MVGDDLRKVRDSAATADDEQTYLEGVELDE